MSDYAWLSYCCKERGLDRLCFWSIFFSMYSLSSEDIFGMLYAIEDGRCTNAPDCTHCQIAPRWHCGQGMGNSHMPSLLCINCKAGYAKHALPCIPHLGLLCNTCHTWYWADELQFFWNRHNPHPVQSDTFVVRRHTESDLLYYNNVYTPSLAQRKRRRIEMA